MSGQYALMCGPFVCAQFRSISVWNVQCQIADWLVVPFTKALFMQTYKLGMGALFVNTLLGKLYWLWELVCILMRPVLLLAGQCLIASLWWFIVGVYEPICYGSGWGGWLVLPYPTCRFRSRFFIFVFSELAAVYSSMTEAFAATLLFMIYNSLYIQWLDSEHSQEQRKKTFSDWPVCQPDIRSISSSYQGS